MSSAISSIRSSESICDTICLNQVLELMLLELTSCTISNKREQQPLTASLTTGVFLTTLRSCNICETRMAATFGPLDSRASVAAS